MSMQRHVLIFYHKRVLLPFLPFEMVALLLLLLLLPQLKLLLCLLTVSVSVSSRVAEIIRHAVLPSLTITHSVD
jgi:hypothetical protein